MSLSEGDLGLHNGALGGENLGLTAGKSHFKCFGGCLRCGESWLAFGPNLDVPHNNMYVQSSPKSC